nr:germination protein YpeB [Clostridia bacterium]
MKKEQKTEVGVNVSSGAEKVERIEKEVKTTQKSGSGTRSNAETTEKTAVKKNATSLGGGKSSKAFKEKTQKENAAAKARVELALKKKEEKAKKKAAKAKAKAEKAAAKRALQEKRAAERKALQEKRAAERKALREKRLAAKEEQIRERAHRKANRSQKRSQARHNREKRREENRSHAHGSRQNNGGWIAAVVTLGVTTLALTTAVTLGAIDMNNTKQGMMSGYRSTTYELIGLMENVDNDLDRIRLSNDTMQQERVLTDLLVQSRLAVLDLEKMPVDVQSDQNVTSFLNRVAKTCERMLAKLRNGERLSAEDEKVLQHLYEVNHEMRAEVENLAEELTDKNLMDFVNKGKGMLADMFGKLEQMTLGENGMLGEMKSKMQGAGTKSNAKPSMQGEGESQTAGKIDPSKAEDLCSVYFSDYQIEEFQCVGETVSEEYGAYNVQGYDNNGTLLFAEIDYRTGDLLRFDYYEECSEDTFDYANAQRIAEEFLERIGYDDMEAVRVRENGTNADFTFVYEDDDVLFYPDTVKIKVCRSRGVVMGMDATKYLRNHKERKDVETRVSLAEAKSKLHEGLEVENARVAVVQTARGERTAYEFYCSYGEEKYLVYTDALDGREISIVNVKNIG